MSLLAMIGVTIAIFLASRWDAAETRRGLLEGRLTEGNALVRLHGGLAGTRKLVIVSVSVGLFWLAYFIESVAHALIYGSVLAGIFCGLALWARRAGRR